MGCHDPLLLVPHRLVVILSCDLTNWLIAILMITILTSEVNVEDPVMVDRLAFSRCSWSDSSHSFSQLLSSTVLRKLPVRCLSYKMPLLLFYVLTWICLKLLTRSVCSPRRLKVKAEDPPLPWELWYAAFWPSDSGVWTIDYIERLCSAALWFGVT